MIILWKPTSISRVDPFAKPIIGNVRGDEGYLVLDGQQRLTSILLMFNNWRIERIGEEISCTELTYNPDRKSITIGGGGVDLSTILKAVTGDPKAFRELMDKFPNHINDLLKLGNKIRNYRIPVYILKTFDENEKVTSFMTEAFVRINKEGVRIGSLELMLSYIGGNIGGWFTERVRRFHNELEQKIGLSLQPVLRFIFSNCDIKMTDIKSEKIRKIVDTLQNKSQSELEDILTRSERSLKVLIEFLKNLGINSLDIVPSQITLVPIVKWLYIADVDELNNLDDKELNNLEKWFILANFRGYYSSQTDTKLEKDLEIIYDYPNRFPISKLMKNMEQRRIRTEISYEDFKRGKQTNVLLKAGKNYLFLLYLLLVKNNADNWSGTPIKTCNYRDLDKHHIFPREFLRNRIEFETNEDEKIKINNLGNITFIDRGEDIRIGNRDPAEYLRDYTELTLEKHFIPLSRDLWSVENYDSFLEERIRILHESSKRFFDFVV